MADDLRQGVSPIEHQVLDQAAKLLEEQPLMSAEGWLDYAKGRVAQAKRTTDRTGTASHFAIDAAAALMLFAVGKRRELAHLRRGSDD